jgi:serine-type D-Ala-D-Ala carboxypeptidase (penicillin-binding protein 5/6)
MQSFGRRPGARRLPVIRPLPALGVVLASLLVVTSAFVAHRLWPLTDRAAGVITASGPHPPPGGSPSVTGGPPPLYAGPVGGKPAGVAARSGVVVDAVTGRVLWAHRARRPAAIASLTKLMTALVVSERRHGLDRPFRVTPAMIGAPGYTLGLAPGDRVTVRRMLAAALVASANDAADVLAIHRAGSVAAFVRLMNARARALGLRSTHYSNASGIVDAGNHSSAWDVAALSLRVLRRPLLARLVATKAYPAGPTTSYVNRNRLLWTYTGAIGLKTGQTTAAGNCIAVAARRGGRTLVAVLLDVRGDEFTAAARSLSWGFRHDR